MNSKRVVVVAMSGGVDSSVAAALLKDRGFKVLPRTITSHHKKRTRCKTERNNR